MAKRKGPKLGCKEPVERRTYVVKRERLEPPSSRVIYFDCPFCGDEIKAYVWSLCGGGKRCGCGALFNGWGHGIHFAKDTEDQDAK